MRVPRKRSKPWNVSHKQLGKVTLVVLLLVSLCMLLAETSDASDSLLIVSEATERRTEPRFAYVTTISGCLPEIKDSILFEQPCLGYILMALANAYSISRHNQHEGTHHVPVDLVLMVEMEADPMGEYADATLPRVATRWLERAGVTVRYLPPSNLTYFELANLNKFRALDLDEYDRIVVVDADILLYTNLDYLFTASYNGYLQPNAAFAGGSSPSNGGLFVITPQKGDFARLIDIIRQARLKSSTFDRVHGWGHKITHGDGWKAWGRRASEEPTQRWEFYAASSDQGLLYHWMRYVQMNYTQFLGDGTFESYHDVTSYDTKPSVVYPIQDSDGKARLLGLLDTHSTNTLHPHFAGVFPDNEHKPHLQEAPWVDHCHFLGSQKPWREPFVASETYSVADLLSNKAKVKVGQRRRWSKALWQSYLVLANTTFGLGLPSALNLTRPQNPHGDSPTIEAGLLNPDLPLPE